MDKVIWNMATIPGRIYSMIDTVKSILPQADELNVYLNNFDDNTKRFLPQSPKINYYESEKNAGDLGDVGKFYMWPFKKGYFFTCDDKFTYPPDYAQKHIEYIEKYKRKAVVSLHGRIFRPGKTTSYYYDCKEFLGCLANVPQDTWAHELGTGVMAFHTHTLEADMSIFKHTNMTDIYFSMLCQKLEIPMLVRKHAQGYLKIITKHNLSQGISVTWNKKDTIMTEVTNSIQWEIRKL